MRKVITRWRQEHEDWEALAAFALSKNTGRRFKNKPHGDSDSMLDLSVDRETGVSQSNLSEMTAEHFPRSIPDIGSVSDSVNVNTDSRQTASTKSGVHKPSKTKDEQNASHELQSVDRLQMQQPSDESCCRSATRCDVVVKQISLDELSDEELFLPPPDDDLSQSLDTAVENSSTKTANSFFVVSNDEESSDDETAVSKALAQTVASPSDTDDDDDDDDAVSAAGLRNSIKSSTKFAKSLSRCRPSSAVKTAWEDKRKKWKGTCKENQHLKANAKKHFYNGNAAGKRFSDGRFAKSGGSRYLKKNGKFSCGNAKVYTKYAPVMFVMVHSS